MLAFKDYLIMTLIFNASQIMMGDYTKLLNSKFTPNSLSPADLIRAMHLAPELSESINTKLKENGLDDSDIKLAKISAYQTIDVMTVRDCMLRGIITSSEAVNRLEEVGFTPKRIDEIMKTWDLIPSPQDLFWMVGKEAFEPDQIQKFGLDAEFPSDQVQWLNKQGYSTFWAKKYWAAHWDYPSEGRVLELFHRGIINDADLDAFYRVIEIPQYWREKLKQASYSLYTRVDLRRMHDMKIINEQQVYDNFRAEGYDDQHARNMTLFYLNYNELNDKDLSISQIKNAYENDLITRSQAVNGLTKLQYSAEQAAFILDYADYEESIKLQKIRIKSIAKSFKGGIYTLTQVRNMLGALNVESKWIEAYITQWSEELYLEEKLPDKSEILKWYFEKGIDRNTFVRYLKRMGYNDDTINIYERLNRPTE